MVDIYNIIYVGNVIDALKYNGVEYIIDEWNGEKWVNCWIDGEDASYTITPIYSDVENEMGCFDIIDVSISIN